MRTKLLALILAASASATMAVDLSTLCTVDKVIAALPPNGTLSNINVLPEYTTASVANVSSTAIIGGMGGMKKRDSSQYCNVTLTYAHTGTFNLVVVHYAFPDPSDFQNRFYVPGGGGYSLATIATGGLQYGAAGGVTDAGYDAFTSSLDAVALNGNGSIHWDNIYMFGYQALGEMTTLAKNIIPKLYGLGNNAKIFTYYEGCSDGGREGMSQVQQWGDLYDGVIVGAPAFRLAMQQVNHIVPSLIEKTLDYYPPPCELSKITNLTIAACDALDGRKDGVIGRSVSWLYSTGVALRG
jgi:tannase